MKHFESCPVLHSTVAHHPLSMAAGAAATMVSKRVKQLPAKTFATEGEKVLAC
jgi:hypothetical protein